MRGSLLAACAVALTGCVKPQSAPDEALREFSDRSVRAAVAKPGTRVCRRLDAGIAEYDLVRGVVVRTNGEEVAVRVEGAGRHVPVVGGVQVTQGAVIWDTAKLWTPCF